MLGDIFVPKFARSDHEFRSAVGTLHVRSLSVLPPFSGQPPSKPVWCKGEGLPPPSSRLVGYVFGGFDSHPHVYSIKLSPRFGLLSPIGGLFEFFQLFRRTLFVCGARSLDEGVGR